MSQYLVRFCVKVVEIRLKIQSLSFYVDNWFKIIQQVIDQIRYIIYEEMSLFIRYVSPDMLAWDEDLHAHTIMRLKSFIRLVIICNKMIGVGLLVRNYGF